MATGTMALTDERLARWAHNLTAEYEAVAEDGIMPVTFLGAALPLRRWLAEDVPAEITATLAADGALIVARGDDRRAVGHLPESVMVELRRRAE